MKNNITLIGINFYPEDTAIGLYSTQMCEYLLSQGYSVDVVTGFPYYPKWEISEEYKNKPKFLKEKINDLNVYRYKQYVPKDPSFKSRIVHLVDFTFGSFVNLFKVKNPDLVICVVPFTTSILLGLILAKLRGAKVWTHIQDFEFDAAVDSGLLTEQKGIKRFIFNFLFLIEKKLLDKSDLVSTISFSMLDKLHTKSSTQSYYFPNWIDENFVNPKKAKQHRFLQSDKFKILYSGNIGEKQDWDFFLRLVAMFKEDESVEFIVVGAGARKDTLVEETKKLSNISHYDPVDYAELPDLLCSADLHILFQKNNVLDTVMPSKLLGMMASAKPSLLTGNLKSEVASIFSVSNAGYFFDTKEIKMCYNAINKLKNNYSLCEEIGSKARNYIIREFSSQKVLNNFAIQVQGLIDE